MNANTSATGGYLQPIASPPNQENLQDDVLTDLFQEVVVKVTNMDPTLVRPRWQPSPPAQPDVSVSWAAIGIAETRPDVFPSITHLAQTYGQILGGAVATAEQTIALWQAITDGCFMLTVDGGDPVGVQGVNFSAATSLTEVAALVTSAMSAQGLPVVCNWVKPQFTLTGLNNGDDVGPMLVFEEAGTDLSSRMLLSAETLHAQVLGSDGCDQLARDEEIELRLSFYGPDAGKNGSATRDGLGIAQNREQLQLRGMNLVEVSGLLNVPAFINNKWYQRMDLTVTVRRRIVRTYPVLHLNSASGTIKTALVETNFEA